jgi:phosphatidylglycerol---prolipoprotein diacylglyceryl transferase
LAAAIAVGRLGCFFSGIEDRTYGTPTDLPWGYDFGDGILRHPVELYEAVGAAAIF